MRMGLAEEWTRPWSGSREQLSPGSSTSAHSSTVNLRTGWTTRTIVAVRGWIILGALDEIFGRILFLFLRLFCGCIVIEEVIPGGVIYHFTEKRIIISLIALRIALLGHRLLYGWLPRHTGLCTRWYGNTTVRDVQEGSFNYQVWRIVLYTPLRWIGLNVVAQDRQWKQLMAPGLTWREIWDHTHDHDGSNPLLVAWWLNDQSVSFNIWVW